MLGHTNEQREGKKRLQSDAVTSVRIETTGGKKEKMDVCVFSLLFLSRILMTVKNNSSLFKVDLQKIRRQ